MNGAVRRFLQYNIIQAGTWLRPRLTACLLWLFIFLVVWLLLRFTSAYPLSGSSISNWQEYIF